MLANDDVRMLREMAAWYRHHRTTAQLPNPNRSRHPRSVNPDDWTTIQVKNNSDYPLLKWSPVWIERGQFEPGTSAIAATPGGSAQLPPSFLEHPQRLFSVKAPQYPSVAAAASQTSMHAVVTDNVAPQAIGVAVVKGIVPGMVQPIGSSTEMDYSRNYCNVLVKPASINGSWPFPGAWGFHNSYTVSSNIASRVVYVFDKSGTAGINACWGMIDLNSYITLETAGQVVRGGLGIDELILLGEGQHTVTTTKERIGYITTETPLGLTAAGTGSWYKQVISGRKGQAAFVRPASGTVRVAAQVKHPTIYGSAIPGRVDPLYKYPSCQLDFWVNWIGVDGNNASPERLVFSKMYRGFTSHSYNDFHGIDDINFRFYTNSISAFFTNAAGLPNSHYPRLLNLSAKITYLASEGYNTITTPITLNCFDVAYEYMLGCPTIDFDGAKMSMHGTASSGQPIVPS